MKKLCLLSIAVLCAMLFLNSCALFHEHKFSEWEIIKEATCTANGEKRKACKCGEAETKIIKATGHMSGEEATCTTAQTCTVCNKELVSALGHQAGESATCTTAQICTVCNEELVKALGHQAGESATCTTAQICTVCNEELVSAHGHQAGTAATCTTAQICTVCNEELVSALGHQAGVAATCTTAQTCTVCNEELAGAFGHSEMIDVAVAPGCESTGLTDGKHCARCSVVLVGQTEIPALGHQYNDGEITVEATCIQVGEKKFTCKVLSCCHSYTELYALPTYTSTEIFDAAVKYTGKITAYDSSGTERTFGTAFVLSSDGKIVTNYHVIEGAYSADVTIDNIKYPIVSLLAYDEVRDLAVLKIDATNLIPARICKNPVAIGSTVYAVGLSKGLTVAYLQGNVVDGKRIVNGVSYIQHNASLTQGYAGGPLINVYGEVIGIHVTGVEGLQNLYFSVFAEELDHMEYGTPTTLQDLYEQKVQAYQEEFDALTSEYNANINELQLKIADCQTNINNYQQKLDYAKIQLRELSPICPPELMQQYLDQWKNYGSTAEAEQAAQNDWLEVYNGRASQLNRDISAYTEVIKDYQSDISQYENQMEDLTEQYVKDVKALQEKYGIEQSYFL